MAGRARYGDGAERRLVGLSDSEWKLMRSCDSSKLAPWAILLAAGRGKRMGGDLPKVLHPVAGRPMLYWVVEACKQAGVEKCVVVVGYKGEDVRQTLANDPTCVFVDQPEQLGTGHATKMAQPLLAGQEERDVFVLAGDGPLIRAQTLGRMLEVHRRTGAAGTLATSVIEDPTGYGRVVRDAQGRFSAIIEHKDATAAQKQIREIYPSYACFRSGQLFAALTKVRNENSQGEYYLTEVPAILQADGQRVEVIDAVPPQDVLSINTPQELEVVDQILRRRLAEDKAGGAKQGLALKGAL
ncbi:MAG: NTP transferase domain-containing protein [Phycisphaeraceae bacterium]|nr:NTP transferase domain-containing protein [Phycisphaeraceae bacterium]